MGAVKEMLMDCLDDGFVPASERSIAEWAGKLGEDAGVLSGMPLSHTYENRWGEPIEIPVIPVAVARTVGELLPETHETLGWMLDLTTEGAA